MCNSVKFRGRWYSTPNELAVMVGGADKLVWQESNPFVKWPRDKDWHAMDVCLCPIDLAATLQRAGLNWTRGDDPMEWFVVDQEMPSN